GEDATATGSVYILRLTGPVSACTGRSGSTCWRVPIDCRPEEFMLTYVAMRSRRHLLACLTMLLIGAWLGGAAAVHATPEQPSVLILLSGQPGSPGATARGAGRA